MAQHSTPLPALCGTRSIITTSRIYSFLFKDLRTNLDLQRRSLQVLLLLKLPTLSSTTTPCRNDSFSLCSLHTTVGHHLGWLVWITLLARLGWWVEGSFSVGPAWPRARHNQTSPVLLVDSGNRLLYGRNLICLPGLYFSWRKLGLRFSLSG